MEEVPPDDFAQYPRVGTWPSMQAARERSLVVLASGRSCWILENRDGTRGYALHVLPSDEFAVLQELARYDGQNRAKKKPTRFRTFPINGWLACFWLVALIVVYALETRDHSLIPRFANSSNAVFQHGQWWRAVTALFLHSSVAHLAGNILIGGTFCLLAAKSVGNWRAWLWIFLAGTFANLGDAWWHRGEPFVSLGASTATFAALGVLVGANTRWLWAERTQSSLLGLAFPLAAGLALLGWFGTQGENTDVMAHFLGAAAGASIAVLFAPTPGRAHASASELAISKAVK